MNRRVLILVLFSVLVAARLACHRSPPVKVPSFVSGDGVSVRLCTQNLNNYGVPEHRKTESGRRSKRRALARRIVEAGCDVIAVQEVGGESVTDSVKVLGLLAKDLSSETRRPFRAYAGKSLDSRIRNGFLIATDTLSVEQEISFADRSLPKLVPYGPPGYFARGPFAVVGRVLSKGRETSKQLFLVSIHFKSKHNSYKDRTKTKFETLRMQMAEGLRRVLKRKFAKKDEDVVLVVMGDRNSDSESASAEILQGRRLLEDFSRPGTCAVDRDLEPDCPKSIAERPPFLTGLFEQTYRGQGKLESPGSYRFRGKNYLIDEILVRPEDLRKFKGGNGQLAVGMVGTRRSASDHKLLWAEMNWSSDIAGSK